jgi:ankyrin repeat protein
MSDDADYPLLLALEAREPLYEIRAIVEDQPSSIQERISPEYHTYHSWLAAGSTALHIAVLYSLPVEVIRFVYFARPQAIYERDANGRIPLHLLENTGRTDRPLICVDAVAFLVGQWPGSVYQRSKDGRLPVHSAAFNIGPDTAVLRFLIDRYPNSVRIHDNRGNLPLHASALASINVVRLLVEAYPASVSVQDTQDELGCLPLLLAAECSSSREVVQFLVEKYPDALLERSYNGSLPLFKAAERRDIDLVRFLVRCCPASVRQRHRKTGRLPVHIAVAIGSSRRTVEEAAEIARFLIEAWPESTLERDHQGRTPLHAAVLRVWDDGLGAVPLLIGLNPAALQAQDFEGQVPLHLDAPWPIFQVLLNAWPQAVRVQDHQGRFPLHTALASEHMRLEKATLLVAAWQDSVQVRGNQGRLALPDALQVRDHEGRLPLHAVLEHNGRSANRNEGELLDVVRFLVEQSPLSIQVQDFRGKTPLHVWVSQNTTFEMAQLLVQAWPPAVSVRDHQGRLPIHASLDDDDGSLDVVRLLTQAMPESLLVHDYRGRIPLHVLLSQETMWWEMARLLGETLPESMLVPDHQGRLPLHVALGQKHVITDMVQLLLETGPQAALSYVLDGLLPFQFAAASNAPLDVLFFLVKQSPGPFLERHGRRGAGF